MKQKTKLVKDDFLSEDDLLLARKLTHRVRGSRDLPRNANSVDRTKYNLCLEFVAYMNKHGLSQRQLASKINVSESRISEIVHYNIRKITIDKLVELLERARGAIVLEVA